MRTEGRQYRTARGRQLTITRWLRLAVPYQMFLIYGVVAFLCVRMLQASSAVVGSIATLPSSRC